MELKMTLLVFGLYSFLCCFTNISAITFLGEPCTIPEGPEGTCAGLHQCPSLKRLLKAKVTPAVQQYVMKLLCGPIKNTRNPAVCCVDPQPSIVHPNKHMLNVPSCGSAFGRIRVLGGVDADLAEFPWMALLAYSRGTSDNATFNCGGTLINDRYVLTAAHCITSDLVSVRLGEYNTQVDVDCSHDGVCAPPVQDVTINQTIVHEGYMHSRTLIANDIALLRLSRPVNISTEYLQPICLPVAAKARVTLVGKKLCVAGWGRTDMKDGASSDILQKVRLPVMPNAECAKVYKDLTNMTITTSQLCAGGSNNTQDSCSGDSGGPLMTITDPIDDKYVQYGIVSFGPRQCGTHGIPGVYTRVERYIYWILDNITA